MKVEEASKKICPFIENNGSYAWQLAENKEENPKNIHCICGDCMSWVYTEYIKIESYGNGFYQQTEKETETGYCKRLGE